MDDSRVRLLREALEASAMDPPGQLLWLAAGQMPVHQLVLVFDDIYVVVPTMRAEGVPFSDEALEALVDLDARLDAMSGQRHADLWTPAALAQDPRWVEVRDAAGRALRLLPSAP